MFDCGGQKTPTVQIGETETPQTIESQGTLKEGKTHQAQGTPKGANSQHQPKNSQRAKSENM